MLTVPSGTFTITVMLQVNALSTTEQEWRADIVTLACQGASVASFAVVPGMDGSGLPILIVDTPGAVPITQVQLGAAIGGRGRRAMPAIGRRHRRVTVDLVSACAPP